MIAFYGHVVYYHNTVGLTACPPFTVGTKSLSKAWLTEIQRDKVLITETKE